MGTFGKISVGIDGSPASDAALDWATEAARLRGASLCAVHAWLYPYTPSGVYAGPFWFDDTALEHAAKLVVAGAVERILGEDVGALQYEERIVRGSAAQALIEESGRADLVVLGSRGLGAFGRFVLGSVTDACLHHATCPVVVVPEALTTRAPRGEIMVAVDGSEHADRALKWAVEEAALRQVTLKVVHSWQLPYQSEIPVALLPSDRSAFRDAGRDVLEAALKSVDGKELVRPVERVLVEGPAAPAILEAAEDADLIVIGSRGHGGFVGLLLGSVSRQVVHGSHRPVVVVPLGST